MSGTRLARLHRRAFLIAVGTSAFGAALSACRTAGPTGESVRASANGRPYVDRLRRTNGVGPLAPDRELETAALRQAALMAESGRMDHRTAPGRGFVARMSGVVDNVAAAENVAFGRFDVARVMEVWMHSPHHRRNLLDPLYTRYGLAFVADAGDPDRRYWDMILAA